MGEFIKYKGFESAFSWGGWSVKYLVAFYLCLPLLAYFILPFFTAKRTLSGNRKSIAIIVLGDLGHSPRMCYHSLSFSKLNYYVSLCGYLQSEPSDEILEDVNIDIKAIPMVENHGLPFLLFAIEKICMQVVSLFSLLFELRGIDYIMIQNPPSMPLLLISIIFVKLFSRNTKIIIDWHNLNYSILNLKYNNENHPLVRFLKLYEMILGRFAFYNLTVTKRMKRFLVSDFGMNSKKISTLHDRPASSFKPLQELETTKMDILNSHPLFQDITGVDKYKILVSSTSFTPDEDFNILLDALKYYDSSEKNEPLLLIVTGKGPLKQAFRERVKDLRFSKKVIVKTAWLSVEDYPVVLAIADLGVSLHTSSSGIDLPMKIVDFFGCGIPVISLDFPAIDELVKHDYNGVVVTGKDQAKVICQHLEHLFRDQEKLNRLKNGAIEESHTRWNENWNRVMKPRFEFD
ncbi:hypothetical protein PGUG_04668 [Meyerozyma guilliermondii ATCC 6260]|uniref:Chitobiosyldiphosphodolichol beta-mannosyltransferase n=1 Tax=Meyerozyma guilliermondii (strain ATCC 6260 / CBS 566 / DSM 6381 / JCM 1539 / NBRC 10279 / NRRL Y-324) TaxID=294746 RepID=A5DN17_PICGU|nr:uncharacterized protein PGUG_04668 [Meyerozyma guilliermondii ATCC 6260]EDK40570.2 hypothetical protein PGUG_04668 [Meyerozyma guilliermondii ATCC 6260]